MTDIARKRQFAEISKDPKPKASVKASEKKAKKTVSIVPPKEKKAKPVCKDDQLVDFEEPVISEFASDGTLSLNFLAVDQPTRLKKLVDEQIQADHTTFLKTVFLFFFEVIGADRSDPDTLSILFKQVLQPKSNVGAAPKDIDKSSQDQLKIDFD